MFMLNTYDKVKNPRNSDGLCKRDRETQREAGKGTRVSKCPKSQPNHQQSPQHTCIKNNPQLKHISDHHYKKTKGEEDVGENTQFKTFNLFTSVQSTNHLKTPNNAVR